MISSNPKRHMVLLLFTTGLALLSFTAWSENKSAHVKKTYNEDLAKQLGADEYGMKMYVMAFLKSGPNRDYTKEKAAELQKAHMANIVRMAGNGDLVLAGPFGSNDQDLRGIYIFNVKTVEEAKVLTESDPAIQAGSLVMELIPWYGSAAVMQINELHQTLAKIEM